MRIRGLIDLPLHSGHAPIQLITRMKRFADLTMQMMSREGGSIEIIERLSDPLWFQSYGCLLGFDWHSSGLTTVVTGVLSNILSIDRHGVALVGGKGARARAVPSEISRIAGEYSLSDSKKMELVKASKLAAKVDTAAIQSGYKIYHHTIAFDDRGNWAVVQQGMNVMRGKARRMHWASLGLKSYTVKPHSGIFSECEEDSVLNMTDPDAEDSRKAVLELASKDIDKVRSVMNLKDYQLTLDPLAKDIEKVEAYEMPFSLDFSILDRIYDIQPRDMDELLLINGVGASVVRALALTAQLIFGTRLSWRDPVKYSYAVGGKDGVPFPIDYDTYDKLISYMKQMLEGSELTWKERKEAMLRLTSYFENNMVEKVEWNFS